MRAWLIGGALAALSVSAALAAGNETRIRSADATPTAESTMRNSLMSENAQARRDESSRQKRWDDRMRRVTNSMCDRC